MTIELEEVAADRGGKRLFGPLTLDISTDSCYLVTGEHGSGKTSLIRILMGLDKPDEGRVRLLGDYKYAWLACGAVFQDDRLMPWLTAVENVTAVRKRRERSWHCFWHRVVRTFRRRNLRQPSAAPCVS